MKRTSLFYHIFNIIGFICMVCGAFLAWFDLSLGLIVFLVGMTIMIYEEVRLLNDERVY